MAFILMAEREHDVVSAFQRYRAYLNQRSSHFPISAYELATSEWYFNFSDHKCPHDAWLKDLNISETSERTDQRDRNVSLRIQLLGAYHDGVIELFYPTVYSYQLSAHDSKQGHHDWGYDEFRLSDSGTVIHEIEWADRQHTGKWLIEANDVQYTWSTV